LSLNLISESRVEKHNLILQLHESGLDDAEIAKYLNQRNIKTPRGRDYYRELVFVTRRKLKLRNERKMETTIELGKLVFLINKK